MKRLLRRLRNFREGFVIWGRDNEGSLVLKAGLIYFTLYKDQDPIVSFGAPEGGFFPLEYPRATSYEITDSIRKHMH